MFKAVVFDLDGTLARFLSWTEVTRGMGVPLDEHADLYKELKEGGLTQEEASKKLRDLWISGGKATKKHFLEIFENIPLRKGAEETTEYLRSKGYKLCIITGAIDLHAETVAEKLRIKRWFANAGITFDKAGNLEDFYYDMRQVEKKLEQFGKYIKDEGLKPEECVVVGDSWNDSGLFKITGNGIAIRSESEDKELEDIAWKVVDELPELKDIL